MSPFTKSSLDDAVKAPSLSFTKMKFSGGKRTSQLNTSDREGESRSTDKRGAESGDDSAGRVTDGLHKHNSSQLSYDDTRALLAKQLKPVVRAPLNSEYKSLADLELLQTLGNTLTAHGVTQFKLYKLLLTAVQIPCTGCCSVAHIMHTATLLACKTG
jgi:hypothetical protein